jgi:hypothetical protein
MSFPILQFTLLLPIFFIIHLSVEHRQLPTCITWRCFPPFRCQSSVLTVIIHRFPAAVQRFIDTSSLVSTPPSLPSPGSHRSFNYLPNYYPFLCLSFLLIVILLPIFFPSLPPFPPVALRLLSPLCVGAANPIHVSFTELPYSHGLPNNR